MKNKKKTITTIIIIIAVIAVAFAAWFFLGRGGNDAPTLTETVDSRILAYETDLRDSIASMDSQQAVKEYLVNWAKNKDISVSTDNHNNIILQIPATEGLEANKPSVILCGYDYSCIESSINSIVSALTIAKNDQTHGEYTVIFLSEDKGDIAASEALADKYFSDDSQVFYLGNSNTSRIANATGGYEEYSLSKALKTAAPTYNAAYKISISGIPAQRFGSSTSSAPNAVKILGSQLANLKSKSIWFELASFSGGSDAALLPSEASVTVVISNDLSVKFENNMERAVEKFIDKYQEDYPDVQYTYEPVELPAQVIAPEDANGIVSLMYTALNGVHYKDDNGDIASLVNIGYIDTEDKTFKMSVAASSWDAALLAEISEAYQTTAGLTDFTFEAISKYAPCLIGEQHKAFEDSFRSAYKAYRNVKLDSVNMPEFTPLGVIAAKNQSMEIIALGITERTKDNFAGGIITYLSTSQTEA